MKALGDAFDFTRENPPLQYESDEGLIELHYETLKALRLYVDRYDMTLARLASRKLDRIEEEMQRRRFDCVTDIYKTMLAEGGR